MPELDFMIVSDYVRAENGVLHLIAGGVDTITVPAVPATRSIGIGLSLKLPLGEVTEGHALRVIFYGTDGARIAEVGADLPARSETPAMPSGRKVGVVAALNMPLPLPAYGDYSLELLVNGNHEKAIPIYVLPPAESRPYL
jgi:hypothetical protein